MILETFQAELNQIENKGIREFTEYVLQSAPQYFSLVPSSSTKKYHPPQSNQEPGGLHNHLRATVEFGATLCRAFNLEKDMKDAVLAACLLHDVVKYSDYEQGIEIKQRYTTKTHDYDGAMYVYKAAGKYKDETGKDVPLIQTITAAIAWHMGRWTVRKNPAHVVKRFPEDYDTPELIVHLADMCSANKNVHMLNIDSGISVA